MPSGSSAPELHTCPRCGREVSHAALQAAVSRIGTTHLLPHFRAGEAPWGWACGSCLDSGRVLVTSPRAHAHLPTMGPAREYLFWDREKTCKVCRAPFTFTAREQQRWYEHFRIPIEVDRVRCDGCQRRRRAELAVNDLVPGASPDNIVHAAALADAYEVLGSTQKHAYWSKRLAALLEAGHRLPPQKPSPYRQALDKAALKERLRRRKRARKQAAHEE